MAVEAAPPTLEPNSSTPASQAPPQVPARPQSQPAPAHGAAVDTFDLDEEFEFDDGTKATMRQLRNGFDQFGRLKQEVDADRNRPAAERAMELLRAAGQDPAQQAALKEVMAKAMMAEVEAARQPKVDPSKLPSDEMIQLMAELKAQREVIKELVPDVEQKIIRRVGDGLSAEITPVAEKVPYLATAMKKPEVLGQISRHLMEVNRQHQQRTGKPMGVQERARWAMDYNAFLQSTGAPASDAPPPQKTAFTTTLQGNATMEDNYLPDRIPNPVHPGQIVYAGSNAMGRGGVGNNLPGQNPQAQNQRVDGHFNAAADWVPGQVPASIGGGAGGAPPQQAPRINGPGALRDAIYQSITRVANGYGTQQ